MLVGRLVEKKGVLFAIEAFNQVLKEFKNVELRIIGDGELKEKVVNLINELNGLEIKNGNAYFVLRQSDLDEILEKCRSSNLKLGTDVGLIAYNDSPLYEFI